MSGFKQFLAEQGVVGLAVGFILGGAVSELVSSIVENILNPLIGIAMGGIDLAKAGITVGEVTLYYGNVIGTLVDFIVIAAFVYWGVKKLGLDKLDAEKAE